LRRRILSNEAVIGIVGQGYVGVSLACAAADAGFPVVGVDVDVERAGALARGEPVVPGVDDHLFRTGTATGRISFSADTRSIGDSEVVLICVPTPLRDHAPDLSYMEGA
jgi:UDP-N-acetyl-D-mannosaminuronate dehydrogenase